MTKKPTNDLAGMRAALATLQTERRALQGSTRDQGEARAEIAAYVAQAAEPIATRLRYATATSIGTDLLIMRPRADGAVDLGPVLVAVLGPDVLAAALSRYVDELPPASAHAERATRLAEIAAELDRLEEAEEIEVCRLEQQGMQVDRRADADPRVVLAIRS